jgi:hypothetical protein
MLSFYKNKNGALILAILMGLNLAYGIYISHVRPLENRSLNRQELTNECIVAASTIWKILYSDVVWNQEDKYFFAKMEITFILAYCFFNLVIILFDTFSQNQKIAIYMYNFLILKWNKFKVTMDN